MVATFVVVTTIADATKKQEKGRGKDKKAEKRERGVDPVIEIKALFCSYFLSQIYGPSLVWVQLHMEF